MLADDPQLAGELFEAVGDRLLRYYRICVKSEHVGAIIAKDDWGYGAQTLLSPAVLRKYVFPWYREIVKSAHEHGKYAILHSCGMLDEVMNDIVRDIGFDAKHSYEDKIRPVEDAYELYAGQIAVVGGIDMSFLCNAQPDEIAKRGQAMLNRSVARGGYALGSGNSIPDYVPFENYLALLSPTRFA
jgi:uroporphyrinogen decarboxylase